MSHKNQKNNEVALYFRTLVSCGLRTFGQGPGPIEPLPGAGEPQLSRGGSSPAEPGTTGLRVGDARPGSRTHGARAGKHVVWLGSVREWLGTQANICEG